VTTDGAGNWVGVWDSQDDLGGTIKSGAKILVARSADNGATWTEAAVLSSNSYTSSLDNEEPQVTTDGEGNWVAVWHSRDDLGGTIGTDDDILYSTEVWPPPPAVGGIVELQVDGSDSPASPADGPGAAGLPYAAIAGGAAAALVALGAGGWYARRRRLR
jgi:hypothetical protein